MYAINKANRQELFGTTAEEQVRVAQVRGVYDDLKITFFRYVVFLSKEQYAECGRKNFDEKVFPLLKKLDAVLAGHTFAVGNNVTFVDFPVFEIAENLNKFDASVLNSLTNLKAHHTNVANLEPIKNYLSSDRFAAGPFYPPHWETFY